MFPGDMKMSGGCMQAAKLPAIIYLLWKTIYLCDVTTSCEIFFQPKNDFYKIGVARAHRRRRRITKAEVNFVGCMLASVSNLSFVQTVPPPALNHTITVTIAVKRYFLMALFASFGAFAMVITKIDYFTPSPPTFFLLFIFFFCDY